MSSPAALAAFSGATRAKRALLRRSEQQNRAGVCSARAPTQTRRKLCVKKLQSLGPVERFGRAVDRFLPFAFFLLVDFDFFARGIITSVLLTHSLERAWQSQERI